MGQTYRHAASQLDNGLTVVTVALPHLHSASVSCFVRTGSRHETAADNGLSHFLEHMVFRGCDGFSDSTALNAAVEDLGGVLDGYATRDHTAFETTVHPRHVTEAAEILGRMLGSPTFVDVDTERAIVLEEQLDAVDSRGRRIEVDDVVHALAFGGHSLGQPIDGSKRNVRRFSVADLHRHRARAYGARNSVLAFCGDIDPAVCRRAARRAFGDLQPGRPLGDGGAPPAATAGPQLRCLDVEQSQVRARLSFRTVPETHRDHVALVVLRRIVDGGLSSRLPRELVERRGLAYEVGTDLVCYSDCGLFNFELALVPERLGEALDLLGEVILGLRAGTVDDEEIDRVRRRAHILHDFLLDSPQELAHWFGACRLFFAPPTLEQRLRQLVAVEPATLRAAARRYLRPERLTAAVVGGLDRSEMAAARRAFRRLCATLE